MPNIINIKLEGYKLPNPSPGLYARKTGLVFWGEENNYPYFLLSLLNKSSKHAACVNGKVRYVKGSGILVNGIIDVENNISKVDTFQEQIQKVAYDYEVFNGFALEVILDRKGGFGSINHIRRSNLRIDYTGNIWYSENWLDKKILPIKKEKYSSLTRSGILIYDHYNIEGSYYPRPVYESTISYIETDSAIATFRLNNIKNGFSAGTILSLNSGIPSADEQKIVERKLKNKFAGEENAGNIVITFSNGSENAPTVTPLLPNNFDKLFTDLDNSVQQNIFIGHSITSPMLLGVRVEGQLGGRSEIAEAHEIFQHQYVDGRQADIEGVYNYLLKPYNTEIKILPVEGLKHEYSESVLMSIMTKDELRKSIGLEPLNILTPEAQNKFSKDQSVLNKLKSLGSDNDEIVRIGFKVEDSKDAEFKENLLTVQNFSVLTIVDKNVLDHISKNPKATIKNISDDLDLTIKEATKSVNNLIEEKYIQGKVGAALTPTQKGKDEIKNTTVAEVETKYRYALRTGVPAAVNGSREFCVNLMALSASGKLWTREQIDSITNDLGTDAWQYRGGFYHNPVYDKTVPYCRHIWEQVIVKKK